LRLNCAALPEALLEAELFGYERGAFTGAVTAKRGLLESANGGTVLLDEIGELPVALQAKILRVFEVRQILPVGAVRPRDIDVRFVAATNRALEDEVRASRFREDLYFRLNGAALSVPPLRDRRAEIEPLTRAFVANASSTLGRAAPAVHEDVARLLERYPWPGNVRELKNVVERAVLLCTGHELLPEHFPVGRMAAALPVSRLGQRAPGGNGPPSVPSPASTRPAPPSSARWTGGDEVNDRERILQVLSDCGGNQSRAAKALGMSRSTLVARLDAYGVPRPRKA